MKKILFLSIGFSVFLFADCYDSFNAQISEKAIKSNYKMEDNSLNNELSNIISYLKEHTKKDENDYLISFDNKNLNIDSLVNLREKLLISSKINQKITLQE